MATIIKTQPHNVTVGVIDQTYKLVEDLQSVTFKDVFGTVRTVYAHSHGPFGSPEAIVKAYEEGVLHTHPTHESAVQYWRDKGAHEFADLLEGLTGEQKTPPTPTPGVFG